MSARVGSTPSTKKLKGRFDWQLYREFELRKYVTMIGLMDGIDVHTCIVLNNLSHVPIFMSQSSNLLTDSAKKSHIASCDMSAQS